MADLAAFRASKSAGRQAYFASRRFNTRGRGRGRGGRGGRLVADGDVALHADSAADANTADDHNDTNDAESNNTASEERSLLKRITAELLQADCLHASSIDVSLKELELSVRIFSVSWRPSHLAFVCTQLRLLGFRYQAGGGGTLNIEALVASLSSLPLYEQLGVPAFVLEGVPVDDDDVECEAGLDVAPSTHSSIPTVQPAVLGSTPVRVAAAPFVSHHAQDLAASFAAAQVSRVRDSVPSLNTATAQLAPQTTSERIHLPLFHGQAAVAVATAPDARAAHATPATMVVSAPVPPPAQKPPPRQFQDDDNDDDDDLDALLSGASAAPSAMVAPSAKASALLPSKPIASAPMFAPARPAASTAAANVRTADDDDLDALLGD